MGLFSRAGSSDVYPVVTHVMFVTFFVLVNTHLYL
jgi:hypothetical protein